MNIPERIRIGGIEYSICNKDVVVVDLHECTGSIHYGDGLIELSNVQNGHDSRCVTLLHEVFRGIARHMGLEIENEETVVDAFARGMYMVLEDNADRLFDLASKQKEEA